MSKVINFLRRVVFMISLAQARALDFEAEHAALSTGTETFRSAASGGIAVNLQPNDYLMWSFPTNSSCDVSVTTVRYSNDGDSDVVELKLDEFIVGRFTAVGFPQGGDRWNVFDNTNVIGDPVTLPSGQHTLKLLVVTGDTQGVEIDLVTLSGSCVQVGSVPPTQELIEESITGSTDGNSGPIAGVIVGLVIFVALLASAGIGTVFLCYRRYRCQRHDVQGREIGGAPLQVS